MTTISLIELSKTPDWYNFVMLCLYVLMFVFMIVSAIAKTKNYAVGLMCLIFALVLAIVFVFFYSQIML